MLHTRQDALIEVLKRTLLFIQSETPNKLGYVPTDLIDQIKKAIKPLEGS